MASHNPLPYLQANYSKRKRWYHKLTYKFHNLEKAIMSYDKDAHIPELEYVIEFATLSEGGKLSGNIPEALKVAFESSETNSIKTTQTSIKASLLECEKILKDSLSGLKLKNRLYYFWMV